jgi:poly-gamma-glutamate synthesis protein (capsule biosynthesis protein)
MARSHVPSAAALRSQVICAVGDVALNRPEPRSALAAARPVLAAADITFGNCESTYAVACAPNPVTHGVVRADPGQLDAVRWAGFGVMSFANNHHLDAGYDAFFETLGHLRERGIATCGAGPDLRAASAPALIERDGTTYAFLAYSAILFPGYAAAAGKPGAAPLEVTTHYEMTEIEQPGCAARVTTTVTPATLARLRHDVLRAREAADVVVVSAHWGTHFIPVAIADYESQFGRAAIDAGADLVLGHHQHILKAVEVYRGKVIFHGLGNFVMDVDLSEHAGSPGLEAMRAHYGDYGVNFYPDYPTYPFHPDTRRTVIAKARVDDGAVTAVSVLPCLIDPAGQPVPLEPGDPRFDDVVRYQQEVTAQAGLSTAFAERAGELHILLGQESSPVATPSGR